MREISALPDRGARLNYTNIRAPLSAVSCGSIEPLSRSAPRSTRPLAAIGRFAGGHRGRGSRRPLQESTGCQVCGRFVQAVSFDRLVGYYGVDPSSASAAASVGPRFNMAPSQQVLQVLEERSYRTISGSGRREGPGQEAGISDNVGRTRRRVVQQALWGFLFPWADSPHDKPRPINARLETVGQKRAFRAAMARARSIVPADGFYEWKAPATPGGPKANPRKIPYFVRYRDGTPLSIAAIWSAWSKADREDGPERDAIVTCALLTMEARGVAAEIHDRMPVLLLPSEFDVWLDPTVSDIDSLVGMLLESRAYEGLEAYPVDRRVNDPRNDDPSLLEPVGPRL